jgi:hypothetical protein
MAVSRPSTLQNCASSRLRPARGPGKDRSSDSGGRIRSRNIAPGGVERRGGLRPIYYAFASKVGSLATFASMCAWFSGPLIRVPHYSVMVFTPAQYRRIAETYESAAADHTLSPAQRSAFAHKADWYRLLSRLGDKPKWAMPTKDHPLPHQAERNPGDRPSTLSSRLRSLFAWQQHR